MIGALVHLKIFYFFFLVFVVVVVVVGLTGDLLLVVVGCVGWFIDLAAVVGRVRRANPVVVTLVVVSVNMLALALAICTAVSINLIVLFRDSEEAHAVSERSDGVYSRWCSRWWQVEALGVNVLLLTQEFYEACLFSLINDALISNILFSLAHLVVVKRRRSGAEHAGRGGWK